MTRGIPLLRASYDFETWNWTRPFAVGLKGGEDFHYMQCKSAGAISDSPAWQSASRDFAIEVLERMATITNLYRRDERLRLEWWAHNGGKFDALILLEAAANANWRVEANVTKAGRITSAKFFPPTDGPPVVVFDSYAVIQASLKKALESFQCKTAKLFTEEDYSKDVRTWERERLKAGVYADCAGVLELLDKVETHAKQWNGALKGTFSSTALTCIKGNLDESLPSHEGIQAINEICREAFYGGRVEVFHHMPSADLCEWDVNSSYPYSMTLPLPWECQEREEHAHIEGEGVTYASVNVPHDMRIPVLPFRDKADGVFFPTGEWDAWFTNNELRYAATCGVEIRPRETITYSQKRPFADFVSRVYATKQTATGAVREFSKTVLNGGYGKFAQAPEVETLHIAPTPEEGLRERFFNGGKRPHPSDDRFYTVARKRWPKHTHFALAAYITAYSRITLHQGLINAKGLAYSDTDSVHAESFVAAFEGTALGQWKKDKEAFVGRYFAPKIYTLKGPGIEIYHAKGFHWHSQPKTANEEIFEAIITGQKVAQGGIRGARGQIRSGDNKMEHRTLLKQWKGVSNKRRSRKDGTTVPWSVEDLVNGRHLGHLSPMAKPGRK